MLRSRRGVRNDLVGKGSNTKRARTHTPYVRRSRERPKATTATSGNTDAFATKTPMPAPLISTPKTIAQWKEILSTKDTAFLVRQTWIRGNGIVHDTALKELIRERIDAGDVAIEAPRTSHKRARS